MVKLSQLSHQKVVVNLVSDWNAFMSLHYFKQYLVTIFVSEQLNNGLWGECLLESVKVLVLDPVRTDTLVDHTGTVFLYSKLWESLCDHFCDACAFILAK